MSIMKTIFSDGILKQLAPDLIRDSAILAVIEEAIKTHLIENIRFLVFLDRVDEFTDKECDLAAKELHIDWYDGTMTLAEKRKSCKESFILHATFGTPGAVQDLLDIFFSDAQILEWWEYSGDPGHFKFMVNGTAPEYISRIINRIEHVKKKSQILDSMTFRTVISKKIGLKTGCKKTEAQSITESRAGIWLEPLGVPINKGLSVNQTQSAGGD
jgi:hypothetical protein